MNDELPRVAYESDSRRLKCRASRRSRRRDFTRAIRIQQTLGDRRSVGPLPAQGDAMELIRAGQAQEFSNSGVTSRQLLFPENSSSTRLTITRVTVKPGARNPPHRHPTSEQVWLALRGHGTLHLEAGRIEPFAEGDLVRFEDGDLHGFENTGSHDFEYLSVTSPPVNFRAAYEKTWTAKGKA